MHLQLTGRLDPQESYAIVSLDAGNILPPGQFATLQLVNIIICTQEDHDHFPATSLGEYPKDNEKYPETINVRRPRPRPLFTDRRKTQLHVPQLDPPIQNVKRRRRRREADEEEDDESTVGDLEIHYAAGFRNPFLEFEITDVRQLTMETFVTGTLQTKLTALCNNHFQRLLHFPPKVELIDVEEDDTPASDRKQRKKKIQLTLPPLTRLMSDSREFFRHLGLEEFVQQIEDRQMFAIENLNRESEKKFTSTATFSTALKFSFYLPHPPPDKFRIYVQRLDQSFQSILTLSDFCNKNVIATVKLFQLMLNCIIEVLALPEHSLIADSPVEDILAFDKAANLIHADDSSQNFNLKMTIGAKLVQLLGLPEAEISWSVSPRSRMEIKLIPATPDEIADESSEACSLKIAHISTQMLNQRSSNEFIKAMQEKWQRIQTDAADAAGAVVAEEAEHEEEAAAAVEAAAAAATATATEEFETITIANPRPRPPKYFTVANRVQQHICTKPAIFPEYCTLILKEGEPQDYLSSRGLCSVLGLVRKSQPNIVSNNCILRNAQTIKNLSIEFVDEALNTFKVTGNKAIWIKLDFKCTAANINMI
jgi:hypothetical protein